MRSNRTGWLPLAAALFFCAATQAQNVPAGDPYAARIDRCLQAAMQDEPQIGLPLAESILAERGLPDAPRLNALTCKQIAHYKLGQSAQALATVERIVPLLEAPSIHPDDRFAATMNAAGTVLASGRAADALALYDRALALAGDDSPHGQVAALQGIALVYSMGLEDHDRAEPYFRQALALIERHRLPGSMAEMMLHYNHGTTLLLAGRADEAEASLLRALAMSEGRPAQERLRHAILGQRGEIARLQGDMATARTRLEQALAWQRAHHDARGEASASIALAELHLQRDAPDEALPHAQHALALAEQGGFAPALRGSLRALADVHARLGDPARAAEYTERARALERETSQTGDQERLTALQARADASARRPATSPRSTVLRDTALGTLAVVLAIGVAALYRRRRRNTAFDDALPGPREAIQHLESLPPPDEGMRHALLLIGPDAVRALDEAHADAASGQLAQRLREACDGRDLVARWHGDAFVVVRPDTTREAAFALAEHLRRATDTPGATASVGVAPCPFFPGSAPEWDESARMAGHALGVARHAGGRSWSGLWGLPAGDGVDPEHVRLDPQAALARGWIAIDGDRPMPGPALRSGSIPAAAPKEP